MLLGCFGADVTTSYLTVRAAARSATATVHGFTVTMIWGTAILLAAAVPVAVFINAKAPARRR